MARPSDQTLLFEPNLSINGAITESTVPFIIDRLKDIRESQADLVAEINTEGGDADVARRVALEIRLFSRYSGKEAYCIGKSNVYSAGVTIFAAFARRNRFLTDDAILLIHERRLDNSIQLTGPIRSCLQIVREQLSLLKTAQDLELAGFEELIAGSELTIDELSEMAATSCYMKAEAALRHGIIGGIVG